MWTARTTREKWPVWRLFPCGGDDEGDPAGQAEAGLGPTPGPARLLVVEDDWLIAMQIEQTLAGAGFEIVGLAADAADAVILAGRHRPDLVLMDIRLRGAVDGVQAATEIADRYGVACLFVSAHTDQATITRTLAARPRGWLAKPFTDWELLAAVSSALVKR